MKKGFYSNTIVLLVFIMAGCTPTLPDNLSFVEEKEVYGNISKIRNVLSNVYNGLPGGYNDIGASWLAAASDEAEEVNNSEPIQLFNLGNITTAYNPDDVWEKHYHSIYDAMMFLKGTDTVTWKNLEITNPTEYASRRTLTKQYRAEARFLIAFFYFELVKRYGGVPLVDKLIDRNSHWMENYPRKSFAECIDHIIYYCDSAAVDLPPTQDAGNHGRATKAAALALKARTLLYAASELYNQPGNSDPLRGYTDGNRTSRLLLAAEANKAIIDYTPAFAFHANYEGLSHLGTTKSNEVIFERRLPASNSFEKLNMPVGFSLGQTGTCPSANLVDAYEQKNGAPFDWSDPALAADPYANRDPRLLKTVVVNYSTYGKDADSVHAYIGGAHGFPRDRATKTGYYLRKYVDEVLDLTLNERSAKQWVYMRLAEFYLNYAEAMNELYGADAAGPGTLTMTARAAVNSLRTRAAVNLPALPAGYTLEEMREAIRHERQVELAFEGHRFWDLRRWMMAGQTLGAPLRGVRIEKQNDGQINYTPMVVENRVWHDRLYFYPIPQTEVIKLNGVIVQNKGW
jgi:SusD family.